MSQAAKEACENNRQDRVQSDLAQAHVHPELNRPELVVVERSPPAYANRSTSRPHQAEWRALSIFSGCGGLDLGFLQEGVFSERAIDIDRTALATYQRNLSDVVVSADLSKYTPTKEGCSILLAGAPCQGFSTAGKRRVHDPRNELLMRVADVALANNSKVIVVENVPAAFSGSHRKLWVEVEDRLRLAGYNVRRILLEGSKYGIAQRRKRLFLLCWKGSDCINVSIRATGSITLREALAGLPSSNESYSYEQNINSKDAKIISHIKPGQKLSNVRLSERAVATWDIPEVFGHVTNDEKEILRAVARLRRRERVRAYGDGDPVSLERIERFLGKTAGDSVIKLSATGLLREVNGQYELVHTYNGRYRRLSWNELSPTVDTRFGRVDLFVHPDENRPMSSREAARIQGFPDSFDFCGTNKDQFTQIGNAVPPPMAAALATFIREAILKG